MSGHNKWSQIKRKKDKADGAKSKLFGKLARLITAEARKAGGNPNYPSLRSAIEKAREGNMPNDNIERAIKKAATDKGVAMEEITYEAYGPGGCALIIEALTDNRNKAAQEVKFILGKHGFALAGQGSAAWAFSHHPAADGTPPQAGGGKNWTAETTLELSDEDLTLLEKLVDDLENCEEVQETFTNAE